MFEKELLDALDIEKDENVDQMIQKVDKAINNLLDYFTGNYVPNYTLPDTETMKNLVTVRNILMKESNLYQGIEKLRRMLQEDEP